MTTFTVSDWKAAFKTQLEARGGLSGVTVYDSERDTSTLAREHIILGDWDQTDTDHAMGGVVLEEIDVTGRIIVRKPDTALAARNRALAIEKEIKDQLVADYETSNTVIDARLATSSGEERTWADGGFECEIEFTVTVRATNE